MLKSRAGADPVTSSNQIGYIIPDIQAGHFAEYRFTVTAPNLVSVFGFTVLTEFNKC